MCTRLWLASHILPLWIYRNWGLKIFFSFLHRSGNYLYPFPYTGIGVCIFSFLSHITQVIIRVLPPPFRIGQEQQARITNHLISPRSTASFQSPCDRVWNRDEGRRQNSHRISKRNKRHGCQRWCWGCILGSSVLPCLPDCRKERSHGILRLHLLFKKKPSPVPRREKFYTQYHEKPKLGLALISVRKG